RQVQIGGVNLYQFIEINEPSPSNDTSLKTIFNNINLDDALTDETGSFKTLNVVGRNNSTRRMNLTDVSGMDGADEDYSTESDREIVVSFKLKDLTKEVFLNRFDRLKVLLSWQKERL